MTKITYIPGEIANAAIDEHGNRKPVTRTQHIFDDSKGKSQADINKEFGNAIGGLNSQNYVTVDSFNALPATGEADTVYRVSNWDGTQQDPSVYSEYAWNGSRYVHLSTKTQIGEVFDISAYHATGGTLATYADLSAALDSNNGGGVPQSLRKGGMSVKFVRTSDNKYVQYRCMAQSFTTDTTKWAVYSNGAYIYNPEFIAAWTDKDKKILIAVENDGNVLFGAGVPRQIIDYINEKIAELNLDEYEDIVTFLGNLIDEDKTLQELLNEKVDKEEGKSLIPIRYIQEIESPEFICVWTDSEKKIILGFKRDGDMFFGYGIPTQIQNAIRDYIGTDNNTIREYLDKTFGYYINDPEGRMEIKTDKEKKIISYRDEDGKLHETSGFITPEADIDNLNVGILNLSPKGVNEFQKILKKYGFSGDKHDYSDYISNKGKNPLHLSIPRLAYVNITNSSNDAIWVTSKTNDFEYIVEYLDDCGNYFKKNAIGNAQGRSSLGHPKKNISLKFFDDSVYNAAGKKGKGNKLAIKYGSWVPQSTFHLKAYYTDFFRGINVVSYALANMIWKSRGIRADRPWKKALIDFDEIGRDYRDTWNKNDMSLQMNNAARCIPDGFPVIAFLNGEFYGIYSWQLKKDAKNFVMEDDNPNHIHLDGVIAWSVLFGADGDTSKVNWNPGEYHGFEIRNPEGLTIVNGDEYDADSNTSQEPIGEDNPGYDSTNESHVLSNEVKKKILALSEVMPTLQSMRDGGSTDAEIKEYFEEHLDPNNIIDYILFSAILYNYDGFTSNWQWVTWDGIKWYICPYDCDGVLGQQEAGNWIMNVNATIFRNGTASQSNPNDGFNMPIKWITTYYKTELAARWAEIKELGCVKFFMDTLVDWMGRIGQDNYEREWKKWPDTPSNRDSNVVSEYWAFAGERSSSDAAIAATGKVYDSTRAYVPFTTTETEYNTCWFKQGYWYKLRCVKECTGVQPLNTAKSALGFHDSIWRAQNMLEHLYNGIDALITNL